MSDSFLPYQDPTVVDKKLDTEQLAVGLNTVHRERVQITGTTATAIAPVSATDGLLVNLGANNDVTVTGTITADAGTGPWPVTDNGGSLTVDNPILSIVGGGTEAAAQRVTIANDSTGLLSVDDNGGSLTVDGSVTVTQATGTNLHMVVDSGTITTITNVVHVDDNAGSLTVDGTVTVNAGTNLNTSLLALEAGGNLALVAGIVTSNRAAVNPISGQVGVQGASGTVNALTQRVVLATDVALPAGTNVIGHVIADTGSTTAVTGNVTVVQPTASSLNAQVVGEVASGATDSGNPVKVGGPALKNPNAMTLVTDGQRVAHNNDVDGMAYMKLNTSFADMLVDRVADTGGTSTAFPSFSAVSGKRTYVTGYSVFNSSATSGYVDFRDGSGGGILWTAPLPAGGGANLTGAAPIFRTSANTALAYDVSAALSTVYISVSGFQSKAG